MKTATFTCRNDLDGIPYCTCDNCGAIVNDTSFDTNESVICDTCPNCHMVLVWKPEYCAHFQGDNS